MTFGLIHDGLKRARINLKEQLPLLYESTFFVGLLKKITRYLRLDIGVHESVKSADPFAVNRHIPLLNLDSFDIGRRSGCSIRPVGTTDGRAKQGGGQEQKRRKRITHSSYFDITRLFGTP